MEGLFAGLANNPELKALKDDPEMQPILEDIAANGMAGMMKHMSNPVLMQKLQGVMGGLMAGMGGGGAMGANQEADPYADAEDLN
mmetsp:Transcript_2494/g.3644  ORF Transcript_2494/g.3644 Transcript_2494/m.3644 type:complete len:85 (+) Transcript_2494:3-257(+)